MRPIVPPVPPASADDAALAAFRDAHAAGRDVGEFVAVTLARLAAEVGGSEAVTANRPGSWEAALVAELLSGTVGVYDEHLAGYRSQA